jgi:hypothetical protein
MHPVLKNAIDNPRMPEPYGADKGDYGFDVIGVRGVDWYIKRNLSLWASNDNNSRRDYRAE